MNTYSAEPDDPFLMRRVSLRLDALREEEGMDSDTSGDSNGEDNDFDGVLDPEGESVYIWMGVVSCCVLYNTWVIILRTSFQQMRSESYLSSYFDVLDVVVDLVYLADIAVHFRTGYLDDGILVTDLTSLSRHYRSQGEFRRDIVSMLPVKLFTLLLPVGEGTFPILRLPRLLKWGTVLDFFQLTDSRTSRPNIVRAMVLILYLASFIHWIACLYYMLSEYEGLGTNEWVYPGDEEEQPFIRKYIRCMYWSIMTLTTIGENPPPRTNLEYIFTGLTFLIGVFLFATVVGNVGDVISNLRHARTEFQARLDRVKMYLSHHSVPDVLQKRVKKWADYSWNRTQAMDDSTFLEMLPRRLRKEIAVSVHLDTLRKVKIFEDCENGLLCDLALKLRSQVYTPGDYVCKSGEIGREMYIISHGKLKVYIQDSDVDQPLEVATLKEGNYFGEISLLKLDDGCNRRSADVVSVGYSELLCLSKKDLIHALVEYPEARKVLEDQGRDRMEAMRESRMQRRKSDASSQSDSSGLKSRFPTRRTTSLPTKPSSGANKSDDITEILLQLKTLDSQVTKERIERLSWKMAKLTEMLNERNEQLQVTTKRIGELERMLQGGKKKRRRSSLTTLTSRDLNTLLSPEYPRGYRDQSRRSTRRNDAAAALRVDNLRRRFSTHSLLPVDSDDITGQQKGLGSGMCQSNPTENVTSDDSRTIPEISINGVLHQEWCVSPRGVGSSFGDDEEDISRLSVSSGSSHDLARRAFCGTASYSSDFSSSMFSDSLYSDTCYDTDYSFYRD
ncbi:cyclic nucleotide-gated channel alpha-3-like [Branchiostoma floridae x Branchiostoma japonicum]